MRAEFIRDSEHTRRDVNFHNYAIINLSGFVVLHADYEYLVQYRDKPNRSKPCRRHHQIPRANQTSRRVYPCI